MSGTEYSSYGNAEGQYQTERFSESNRNAGKQLDDCQTGGNCRSQRTTEESNTPGSDHRIESSAAPCDHSSRRLPLRAISFGHGRRSTRSERIPARRTRSATPFHLAHRRRHAPRTLRRHSRVVRPGPLRLTGLLALPPGRHLRTPRPLARRAGRESSSVSSGGSPSPRSACWHAELRLPGPSSPIIAILP